MTDRANYLDFSGNTIQATQFSRKNHLFPAGTKLTTFGSSTIARGIQYSSGNNTLHRSYFGPHNVLDAQSLGMFTQESNPDPLNSRGYSGSSFGYSGQTSDTLKNYLNSVINYNSPVVLLASFNDYSSTDGRRAYNSVLNNLVLPLLDAGKTVIWQTGNPRDTSGASPLAADAPERYYLLQMNDLIRSAPYKYTNLYVADTWSALNDPTSGISMPKTGVSEDGTHLSYLGSTLAANSMRSLLESLFERPVEYVIPASRNILPNYQLSGTGGTSGGTITGSSPDNIRVNAVTNTYTLTKSTHPITGASNSSLRLVGTPTVTGSSNALSVSFTSTTGTGNSNLTLAAINSLPGEKVRASVSVRVAKGIQYLAGMEFRIEATTSASGSPAESNARATLFTVASPSTAAVPQMLNGVALKFQTEALELPIGTTHLKFLFRAIHGTSGNELDLSLFDFSLEKV